MIPEIRFELGDCRELLKTVGTGSVGLVLCDLPYGMTPCKWDCRIELDLLWREWSRVCKPRAPIVLFAAQPFASALLMSNPAFFRYEIVWKKDKPSNFAFARNGVMRYHESLLIFGNAGGTYNPQMTLGAANHSVGNGIRKKANESGANTATVTNKTDGLKHPKSIIEFNREAAPIHPTQKPVPLCEWLIRTFSNEGETVLDNCAGVATTGVAAKNTGRGFIGFELDPVFYDRGKRRL